VTAASPGATSARPSASPSAGWIARLLGADPAVFVPFARAYALIIRRRSRMRFSRGISPKAMGRISPFHVACFFAALLGTGVAVATVGMKFAFLAIVISLGVGSFLLVFAVLFDYLEVLASPDEYRVIAAHPHDAWSILLAKIVVVGRALGTLATCFFTPTLIAIGFALHSALAVAAFALSATLITIAASFGAMLFGIGIMAKWGRAGLVRFLPAIQTVFLVAYVTMSMGRRWIYMTGKAPGHAILQWLAFMPPA